MSDFKTLGALRNILSSATITNITDNDISFLDPPVAFDPSSKQIWINEDFLPASSSPLGKTIASSDENRGIYELTVYVPLFLGDYGESLSRAVDEIKAAFYYSKSLTYNQQKVDILSATAQGLTSNDAWSRRVISINYLTYSTRG